MVDIGAGASFNTVTGDAETSKRTTSFNLNLNCNLDIFSTLVAEIQFGQLAGGDSLTTYTGRQFTNQFNAFCFRGQMQLGKLSKRLPNAIQRIYLSSGIGVINNKVQENRTSILVPFFTTAGKDKSSNFFVPLKLGYEFPLKNAYHEPILKIDIAYQLNFVLGDDIDGFAAGKYQDTFSQFSLGLKAGIFGRQW